MSLSSFPSSWVSLLCALVGAPPSLLKCVVLRAKFLAGDVPAGVDKVLFVWERGTKVFVTDAEKVHPTTRAVFWKQYLKQVTVGSLLHFHSSWGWPSPLKRPVCPPLARTSQTATIYKDGGKLMPKDYSFKIQSLTTNKEGVEEKKTIGKLKVDLAAYCEGQTEAQPKEVFFSLK